MVAHPAVRRVNFTGSTRWAGSSRMTCAKYLKPVVLELGGKAPLVVLDDADIEDAVNGAAFGCFANSGPDLHEHRAHHRRPEDRRRFREEVRRQGRARCRWATRASPTRWCWAR
jgi:hypothetical protein